MSNMKKVGIPRALFYYKYYPLWKNFFEELSVELVVSSNTTRSTLDKGVANCIDEACLPVKIFHGHVMEIKDQVDFMFIPRFTSITKDEYICPKFGGLPDMVRSTIKDMPQIISPEINIKGHPQSDILAAMETGHYFTDNMSFIKKSYSKACVTYHKYSKQIRSGFFPNEIFDKKAPLAIVNPAKDRGNKSDINVVLIGHSYNLYDNFVNMDMVKKLEKNGVNVITIDMLDQSNINEMVKKLDKKLFWYFGRKAVGSALEITKRQDIAGVIYVMSFGCGVDSFTCDLAERKIRNNSDIPFMSLTIDEHTGQAGIDTRLEAFIDMIRWRKRDEANIPAHG